MVWSKPSQAGTWSRYWKFVLAWSLGGLIATCLRHGLPPGREAVEDWLAFVLTGAVVSGVLNLIAGWWRRSHAAK